jgi:hypothetical protein
MRAFPRGTLAMAAALAAAAFGAACNCGRPSLESDSGSDAGEGVDAAVADAGVDAGQDAGRPDGGLADAGPRDAGTPDAGVHFGPDGGVLSDLYFAVLGDTRPPTPNDTTGYPTVIIHSIYTDIASLVPRPTFALATGDFMNTTTNDAGAVAASAQMRQYLTAKGAFDGGIVFPVMGNHECDGSDQGNCIDGGASTPQYDQFMGSLVAPLGFSTPYYEVPISAADGSWNAKLVVLACNAWEAGQRSWAQAALARPTTYTFLVVHEPDNGTPAAPCVADVVSLLNLNPGTFLINGHVHDLTYTAGRLTVGNGGAPLGALGTFYGYATIRRENDGGLQILAYDQSTNLVVGSFQYP